MQQLKALLGLVEENTPLLLDAVYKDLHKCKEEALLTEIHVVTSEIKTIMANLGEWMKPTKVIIRGRILKNFHKNIIDLTPILCNFFGGILDF